MRLPLPAWCDACAFRGVVPRAGLACMLMLMPLVTVGAQRAELRPGARVRLVAPGVVAGRVEGVILGVQNDTMTFAPLQGAPLPIAVAMVTEAHVYRGKSSRAGLKSGALLGGGIGLALGVLSAGFSDGSSGGSAPSDAGNRVGGALAITVFGAGLGALIGNSRGSDNWVRLALP
jgi:hypothetical protein